MPRTVIAGVAKVAFVPSLANQAAPTTGEIAAGTILNTPGTQVNQGLIEMPGFMTEQTFSTMQDMATAVDSKLAARQSLPDATLKFYDDSTSATIRTALAPGTSGFIVRFPYGQGLGKRCEVWPITTAAVNDADWGPSAEPHTFTVAVAVTGTPVKNAVSPA
jgi:hypothetical protein